MINQKKFSNKEIALDHIMRFDGVPYTWGGDDFTGFDCSGLAIEYLKAGGLLPRGKFDTTAQGLWSYLKDKIVKEPVRGALVFYNNENKTKIIHVEIMLNSELAIGASGGGSNIKTLEDARQHNAFVKVRRAQDRKNIMGFINPWLQHYAR